MNNEQIVRVQLIDKYDEYRDNYGDLEDGQITCTCKKIVSYRLEPDALQAKFKCPS